MSSRITLVTASAVALAVLSGPSLSALRQDVTLRYRWTKGETLRYRIVQQSTTTISGIPGMGDMAIDQSNTQVMATVAEEVTPERTTLRQVIESMKMEMNSPMFGASFDKREFGHRRQSHEQHAEERPLADDRRVVHARDGADR